MGAIENAGLENDGSQSGAAKKGQDTVKSRRAPEKSRVRHSQLGVR